MTFNIDFSKTYNLPKRTISLQISAVKFYQMMRLFNSCHKMLNRAFCKICQLYDFQHSPDDMFVKKDNTYNNLILISVKYIHDLY